MKPIYTFASLTKFKNTPLPFVFLLATFRAGGGLLRSNGTLSLMNSCTAGWAAGPERKVPLRVFPKCVTGLRIFSDTPHAGSPSQGPVKRGALSTMVRPLRAARRPGSLIGGKPPGPWGRKNVGIGPRSRCVKNFGRLPRREGAAGDRSKTTRFHPPVRGSRGSREREADFTYDCVC